MRRFVGVGLGRVHGHGHAGVGGDVGGNGVHPFEGRTLDGVGAVLAASESEPFGLEVARRANVRYDEFVDAGVVFPVWRTHPYIRHIAKLLDDVLDVGGAVFDDVADEEFVGADGEEDIGGVEFANEIGYGVAGAILFCCGAVPYHTFHCVAVGHAVVVEPQSKKLVHRVAYQQEADTYAVGVGRGVEIVVEISFEVCCGLGCGIVGLTEYGVGLSRIGKSDFVGGGEAVGITLYAHLFQFERDGVVFAEESVGREEQQCGDQQGKIFPIDGGQAFVFGLVMMFFCLWSCIIVHVFVC